MAKLRHWSVWPYFNEQWSDNPELIYIDVNITHFNDSIYLSSFAEENKADKNISCQCIRNWKGQGTDCNCFIIEKMS